MMQYENIIVMLQLSVCVGWVVLALFLRVCFDLYWSYRPVLPWLESNIDWLGTILDCCSRVTMLVQGHDNAW